MTLEALRAAERLHGLVAWFAVFALFVAAAFLSLPRPATGRGRAASLSVFAAAVLVAVTVGLGSTLEGPFRARLRQRLFLKSRALGFLFERKEHAAFAVAALLLCAAFSLLAAAIVRDRERAENLDRAARYAVLSAAALALFAGVASVLAARAASF